MLINIHTSDANKTVVKDLSRKLEVPKENIIARIALAYSISTGRKFSPNEFNLYDSKGKEYKDNVLFDASYKHFYIAIICQHYGIYKTEDTIPKYVKLHIDHGLESIQRQMESNPNFNIFDILFEQVEKGTEALSLIDVSLDHVKNHNQNITKGYCSGLIKIEIGTIQEKDQVKPTPIELRLNDTSKYNNFHIAVAGNSGTGKTQFALELLSQIYESSAGKVNYLYLDFKGLKEDDVKNMDKFFTTTQAKFIDAPHTPFPVNPLSFIDPINEKNKIMGINKFVDIIAKYSNIGKKQEQQLKEATKEVFIDCKAGDFPSIKDINEKLLDLVGDKRDTLTEVMESLSELDVFENAVDAKGSFLTQNHYLSLSGDLPNSVRFTSTFLVINYIYNTFMNMENTPVENGIAGIRYVLLIDEAHVLFKDKKSQDLLEKILREIRSKGVIVMLLSQGIEEFNQPNFNFSSMCEIAFLLDVKDKSNKKLMNNFLGFGENEGAKLARSMEKIQKGQAVSNIKEFEKAKLFNVKQFYERE
ncbi:DndE family protein [Labilibaculum euxinus]